MVYPQKPMVKSRTLDLIHFDQVECHVVHSAVCVCVKLGCIHGDAHTSHDTHMLSD